MSASGAMSGAKRAARIRKVVEDVMARRAAGAALPDALVIVENAELMPELARELSLLSMLERARESATGRSRTGRRVDGPIQPMGENAFEGFRVIKEAHRGGQGVVYEAVQASTGRRVAIKMMREGLFAGDRDAARFEREVRILGQLEHPGIVGIIASGIRGGHFYYVMDYVEGLPLDEYAAAQGRRPREVLQLIERVAAALNEAHLKGIIHRDLKPSNILVGSDGRPRILDFGLARIVAVGEQRVTMTGQFVGSMPWSSPEQAAGDQAKVDIRTDVYSLGVIMYQALTGRFPYLVDGSPRDVLSNILNAPPAKLRSSDSQIESGVDAIVRKCLSKERERRYQSAGELAADLRRFLSGRPVMAHPPDPWYQARMFARRNKALVVGAAAVTGAILLGLIGTTTGFLRASSSQKTAVRERDAAIRAEGVAESRRAEAEANSYAASIAAADAAIRVDDGGNAKTQLRSAPERLRGWEWRYLAARADRSIETLQGPPVMAARTTPDGNHLLILERGGVLRLKDLRNGATVWSKHLREKRAAATEQAIMGFSRDGKLVGTQHDGVAMVWEVSSGAWVATLDQPDTTWGIMSASFSPDGSRVVTSGRWGFLVVWSLATGERIKEVNLHVPFSAGADYSPDGSLLAVCASEGAVILDAQTLELIRLVRPPTRPHMDLGFVRFTPDGSRVIVACGPFIAALDPSGRQEAVVFRGGIQSFMGFDLSRDGQHLVAGSWDGVVREWNFRTGELEIALVGHQAEATGASFGLGDSRIYSTDNVGAVKVWLPRAGFEPGVMALNSGMVASVVAPGKTALFHGMGRLRLVDVEAEKELATGFPQPAYAASPSPDGQFIAYTDNGQALSLWNVRSGKQEWSTRGASGVILTSCFSPDGAMIVTTSTSGAMSAWDARSGALLRTMEGVAFGQSGAHFHPRRPELALRSVDNAVAVWNTLDWTRRDITPLEEDAGPAITGLTYSPDGSLLAAGFDRGRVVVWDTARWEVVGRLKGIGPTVWCLAFSPDGQRLAAGAHDRMIHLFQTANWRETLLLRGHSAAVLSVDWTPDGRRLISAGNDGTLRIWDAAPPQWDTSAATPARQ